MNEEKNNKNSGIIVSVTRLYQWCIDKKTGEYYTLINGEEAEGSRSSDKLTAWVYFWERVDMYIRRRINTSEKTEGK